MNTKKFLKMLSIALVFALLTVTVGSVAIAKGNDTELVFRLKSVQVGDYTMTYKTNNDGVKDVIILQHGAFMNGNSMLRLGRELAAKFPDKAIIIPDFVNHRIMVDEDITSVSTYVQLEKQFIDVLKQTDEIKDTSTVGYAGWSMGGSVGLQIAIDESAVLEKDRRIDYLILLNSAAKWETIRVFPVFLPEVFAAIFPLLFKGELSPNLSAEQVAIYMQELPTQMAPPQTSIADMAALREFDVSSSLNKIKIPTMIISGENDIMATTSAQAIMQYQIGIPDEFVNIAPNEGHDLVIDNTSYVADKIKYFLDQIG